MSFLLSTIPGTNAQNTIETMESMIVQDIIKIALILATLGFGLWLRYRVVRRLKKTILDNWIIQTLGVLVVIPPVIVGAILVVVISDSETVILNALHLDKLVYGSIINNLIMTLVLVALGIGIARTIKAVITHGMSERRVDINIRTFLGRISYIVTLTITAFWILSIWQPATSIPVTVLSVLTVTITFAIQDILKDLVAGFYILLERPFYIGDQINITTMPTLIYVGKVEDVQLRATKLRLITGEEVTIPNATIFGGVVTNNTFYGERRATIVMQIPQEYFIKDETNEHILHILKESDKVIDKPEPLILFNGYADEKISLAIRFWVASGQVIDFSDVMYALHEIFPKADLTMREPVSVVV